MISHPQPNDCEYFSGGINLAAKVLWKLKYLPVVNCSPGTGFAAQLGWKGRHPQPAIEGSDPDWNVGNFGVYRTGI